MRQGVETDEGFTGLIHEHRGIIRRLARLYAESPEEREDLEQEICLQLWRAYPSFAGRARASTWMYSVALNTAISSLRRRRRRPPREELHDVAAPGGGAEERDRLEVLYMAIRQLGEGERALVLLWIEELSYDEIAEVLGLSAGAVSVRLVRAKQRLREIVAGWAPRGSGGR
jgi:RNA polymerase sigma-70 factor (ECF subfamily)